MRGTRSSRRLLSPPRRRRPLVRPAIVLIAMLALGLRLLTLGSHHAAPAAVAAAPSARPVGAANRPQVQTSTAARAAPSAAARPAASASASATPSPSARPLPPVKLLAFSGTWLRAHPIAQAPLINGRAAIVVDIATGQILYGQNANSRYPDASLTKMMTAMVAEDLAPLDLPVRVTPGAAQVEPTRMGLSAGEQLSVRELIDGMLLDSGNDAAEALAQGIVDRDRFIALMNEKAAGMHLKDTHFVNPTGLDDGNHFSSAYDVAVMLGTILRDYPDLRTTIGARQISIPATGAHKAFNPHNLNHLLWSYSGTIGGKPGYTDAAGYCLAAAASRDGRTIVSVVLESNRHFSDGAALLDFGFAHPVTR